jgi:hypothetical protein
VEPYISRKTSEMPEFPARGSNHSRVWGFLHGKPHGVRWLQPAPQENSGVWATRQWFLGEGFWVKICGVKILGLALGWSHDSREPEPFPAGLE